jgi:hypothetical protein
MDAVRIDTFDSFEWLLETIVSNYGIKDSAQASYHIVFDKQYQLKMRVDNGHPTCALEPLNDTEYLFGGNLGDKNDQHLNQLISLNPVPKNIGVTNLPQLTLAINFQLFFYAQVQNKLLVYQHDADGYPTLMTKGIVPGEYDRRPLLEAKVKLATTPLEWAKQKWEDGNINKLGGIPTWVQYPEFPKCPTCGRQMKFLIQLNNDLPVSEPRRLEDDSIHKDTIMFGNDGICYGYWCDKDKVSGYIWQCT